jgi:hypothetical protein
MIVFNAGKAEKNIVGAMPKIAIESKIAEYLKP